jgi:hypothetical protein
MRSQYKTTREKREKQERDKLGPGSLEVTTRASTLHDKGLRLLIFFNTFVTFSPLLVTAMILHHFLWKVSIFTTIILSFLPFFYFFSF